MRQAIIALAAIATVALPSRAAEYRAGVAQADITPAFPVRLAGFGFRRAESEGVTQRTCATALAIDDGEPAVLIAADLCGVPAAFTEQLAGRLQAAGVRRERFALTVTHSHTAPMVGGYLPTLFGVPIPDEHRRNIDRYTGELLDRLEAVAKAALAARRPAKLTWGVGKVGFAINRRTKGGPVDHDLPVLAVRDLDGKLLAVYASYACHCVTLSNNKVSGDWAGFAREAIQADHPGALALIAVGCAADQNPDSGVTGDKVEVATAQGRAVAHEVKRLVGGWLAPVNGKIATRTKTLALPLVEPAPRSAWEEKLKRHPADGRSYAIGYHAQVQLAKLDRGETLPANVDYLVQTWTFGDDLAMAFLPGEVVVDYGLRLKRELDGRRLWVNAYANAVPCYIPSERVLKEGGYEGGGAMVYYDLPGPFKPGLEQPIVDAVKELAGPSFHAPFDGNKTGGVKPLSPQQSQAAIRLRPGMVAELVAAEPLVVDPVAIDFGPDGRMYVCEMHDYPLGRDGRFAPAGRVRVVSDADGDGRYDTAHVLLDNIPFPTGVTVWRNGVLVCAAPDILYAEDTTGDGRADVVRKLYSGFGTENYQARVNSLEYGLDGWVYGSCGLFGGTITSFTGQTLNLGNRDFRIKPDTGAIEPATGRTQQGRPRDDWGNWFGCDNTTVARHYPLADHDLRRNPHVTPPKPDVWLGPREMFPINPAVQLFKLSGKAGLPTAVCGLGVYRDDLLGGDVTGDLFSCEPVNLLVTRRKLDPVGTTFKGRRAAGEEKSEFLASTDPWFRPVQARTGPDGCLYVVDMYRAVIEHPRWIPAADLAKLDVRAGSTLGRIYRVRPVDRPGRPMPRLDRLDTAGLVAALDSPNGWQRDLATQMLVWRNDPSAAPALVKLAEAHARPEARLHALVALDGLGKLDTALVERAMGDAHAGVRRHAVRLAGQRVGAEPQLGPKLSALVTDGDAQVRLQVVVALGHWRDPAALVLRTQQPADEYHRAAYLSSVTQDNVAALLEATRVQLAKHPNSYVSLYLITLGIAFDQREATAALLDAIVRASPSEPNTSQVLVFAHAMEELDRHWQTLPRWAGPKAAEAARRLTAYARSVAVREKLADDTPRIFAVSILNWDPAERAADQKVLMQLLAPGQPGPLRERVVVALARDRGAETATRLLAGWSGYGPDLRAKVLDILLSRDSWRQRLVDAVGNGTVAAGQIDAARRQQLLTALDGAARSQAEKLFAGAVRPDRAKVLAEHQDTLKLAGDTARGKAAFAKHCATCHRLGEVGHEVGPDLQTTTTKTPAYLLQEILDPNRNLDSRYVEYRAALKDGRQFNGVITQEGHGGYTLRSQDGRDHHIPGIAIEQFESSGKSLMPEGLEQQLTRQDLADVIAYLTADAPQAVAELAHRLLDDAVPARERQALVEQSTGRAGEVVAALVAGLPDEAKEEYRRIPWVWRVAVAAGKRNDADELRQLLDVSLPKPGEPLKHWQAVVVGGGVINGISLAGPWPRERVADILRGHDALAARWRQALDQSAPMADDAKVPTGTRYDALRMIALDTWDRRGAQLVKYLAKDTHAELQQGAISGLADLDAPPVAAALLSGLGHYSPANRAFALDALMRNEARTVALLDALEQGRMNPALLGEKHRKALREHANPVLKARGEKLLAKP